MNTRTNEARLRGWFLNVVISTLFSKISLENFDITLISEWRTKAMFPKLTSRLIDIAGCIDIDGVEFPILQIEIGKQGFSIAHPSKDLSKTFSTMSMTLHRLVLAMTEMGSQNMPEFMEFGLGNMRFCVAHPVINRCADGKMEVHVHLTSRNDWMYDIQCEAPTNIDDFTVALSSRTFYCRDARLRLKT